jgi:hypothetical protein
MRYSLSRAIPFSILAVLLFIFLAAVPQGVTRAAAAAERALSDAELNKINGWIAGQGRDVTLTPIITDILGLTQNNQTMTCHAFGAVDPDTDDIRHIYLLPAGKGYLIDYFHAQIVEVYWMDKDLALSGIRGQPPAPISFQQAQFGFGNELGWWAKFADTH